MEAVQQALAPSEVKFPLPAMQLPPAAPARASDAAAWEKIRSIALRRLDRMAELEAIVLRGDEPKAIHDFRVAGRRFEQAFDLLCPAEPPRDLLRLRRRISRSRKALSSVRNYDVFIRVAEKKLKRSSRQETWEAIRDYLAKHRARAHARAAKKIGKTNLSRAYSRFHDAIETEAPQASGAGHIHRAIPDKNVDNFSEKLAREIERAWSDFEKAAVEAREAPDGAALHPLRIAAKRLRYLMEIIREFEEQASGRSLEILRGFQDQLGAWRDLDVEEQMLAEMTGRPRFVCRHLDLARSILRVMALNRKAKERMLANIMPHVSGAAIEELKTSVHTASVRISRS